MPFLVLQLLPASRSAGVRSGLGKTESTLGISTRGAEDKGLTSVVWGGWKPTRNTPSNPDRRR